ncbi:hypothetical protein SH661x_000117 [Planctomicrobium sp. SH661]|uniref:hypothetical protein n=1 Tax=Planctomicrobium sp. SH661 TaxID=3448124 RepID=UPI003F5C400E
MAILCGLVLLLTTGCSLPRWRHQAECALELSASKEEIVAHLNQNVRGSEEHAGLNSWRSGSVRLHVDGIPMGLPASIAVQAPRNFRLLVSNPLSGGQEADIGSNQERFWIWSKESPQVLTASHEDVGMAIQELEMPVHIHPDWLMEVFGVVELNPEEFELRRPNVENGHVELVASRQSPLGEDVERVIRVNVCKGRVSEHLLRLPGGKVLARARLDKYSRIADGPEMPLMVTLEWPDARMQMVMDIRNPEINCLSSTGNVALWQMPTHGKVVDMGAIARARREPTTVIPVKQEIPLDPIRAKVRLGSSSSSSQNPVVAAPASAPAMASETDVPEWARR